MERNKLIHDINSDLSALHLSISILEEDGLDQEARKRMLSLMGEKIGRLKERWETIKEIIK